MDKYYIIFKSDKLSWKDKLNKAEELALHEVQKNINNNIKQCFIGKTIWTEKEVYYKDKEGEWSKSTSYFYGDLTGVEKSDWRFCEVKEVRKDVKYDTLVIMDENHGLKQNHIKDYNKYLEKYSTKIS